MQPGNSLPHSGYFFRIPGLLYVHDCLPTSMHVHHVHAWCLKRSEGSTGSPGTGKLHVSWEPNLNLLQEQLSVLSH